MKSRPALVLNPDGVPGMYDGPIMQTPVPGERKAVRVGREDRNALRMDSRSAAPLVANFSDGGTSEEDDEYDEDMPRTPGGHLSKSSPYDNGVLTLSAKPSAVVATRKSGHSPSGGGSGDGRGSNAQSPRKVAIPQEGKQPDSSNKAANSADQPLAVGDKVFGLYGGETRWYSGKISHINADFSKVSIQYVLCCVLRCDVRSSCWATPP